MKVVYGDILNETRGILVHSCNAQGVMGSGFAYQIRKKYKLVYKDYMQMIKLFNKDGDVFSDLLGLTAITHITPELIIVSGIGQIKYGRDPFVCYTNYPAIKTIFESVNKLAFQTKLPVIFPEIGCGLGNGSWSVIEKIIEETLDPSIERTLFKLK